MEQWWKEQTIYLIVAVILMVFTAILFVYTSHQKEKKKQSKYLDVIYPVNETISKERKERSKRKRLKLGVKINNYLEKKGINQKFTSWYVRAGKKNKTSKDFFFDCIKFLMLSVATFFAMYYALGNILIAFVMAVLILSLPPLTLHSKIRKRESSFRNDFPYFLQTIAFVLKNGTNFSQAFFEVTQKQEDTVLKEVMLDVITIQNVNAGDYKLAFKSMSEKIKIEEVSEFVNIVLDNLEKGVSVADVFMNQAQNVSKILNLSIKKKISAVSTKILLPILLLIGAIGILFISL